MAVSLVCIHVGRSRLLESPVKDSRIGALGQHVRVGWASQAINSLWRSQAQRIDDARSRRLIVYHYIYRQVKIDIVIKLERK